MILFSRFRLIIFLVLLMPMVTWVHAQQEIRVPQLIAELQNPDWRVRQNAARSLGEGATDNKEVSRALGAALQDSDSRVRQSAAQALGELGPKASRTAPLLINSLKDIDPAVVASAAEALGMMSSKASRAVPGLRELLGHADPRVRKSAAESLGQIGRKAVKSTSDLVAALADRDPRVRATAAGALGRMGSRAADTSGNLVRLLSDRDMNVRHAASAALVKLGKSTVPVLVRALSRGNPIFLQTVVDTLGKIGRPAVAPLIEKLNDGQAALLARRYATLALARIGSADDRIVPALADRLGDRESDIRMSVTEALGKIGSDAATATQKLIEVAGDSNEELIVREYAIIALSRIGPGDATVVAALVDAVADGNPRIYEAAVAALMNISGTGLTTANAVNRIPELIDQLAHVDLQSQASAATALGRIGPYAKESVPALTEVLLNAENGWDSRVAAATALGLIGPEAESSVPVLVASLQTNNTELHHAALVALRRIGPQTKTIPALLQAMKAGDLAVRGPAAASIQAFAKARLRTWQSLLFQSDAPVLRNWMARHDALYGIDAAAREKESRRRATETTDFFDVLGGRAAIRESVQLQLIDVPIARPDAGRTVPYDRVDTVEVESHPFEKMLKDSGISPGVLPMADIVPRDHFFAYFKSMSALMEILEGGSDLFLRFESAFAVKSVDYDLKSVYLTRLGLAGPILSHILEIDAVKEIGIVSPDLFFVDGTDITVIARLNSADMADKVLQLAGIDRQSAQEITTLELQSGRTVYWSTRDDLLLISTSAHELEKVIFLHDEDGRDSLGQSAEFQYMLPQLPIEEDTQVYLYFSDPFIRHLVGPRTKISQLRRMQVRAEMELLVAGALLYKLDGHHSIPSPRRLVEFGYVPEYLGQRNYVIRNDLTVHSEQFGSMADLKSLDANPVNFVSKRELRAYGEFVRHYSRYWEQFFDPIAVRMDRVDEQTYELTTFILPLLQSDLYDQVREVIVNYQNGAPLRVPVLTPTPTVIFSVNVSDSLRIELSRTLADALVQYTSVNPEIFNSIGSALHLAIQDSTPIIAVGGGDIWGALSEDVLRMEGFESFLPVLLSLVSQPSTLLVELADPDKVVDFLTSAVVRRSQSGPGGEFHQLRGQKAWIYTLNIKDLVQVHLKVAVKEGYLMISNLPWSQQVKVIETREANLNGAQLRLNLDAITQQLPAIHTKVFSDYRSAAVDGMGYLYPLLASGVAIDVADAEEKHLALFGYKPVHPVSGQWLWQGDELASSIFGTAISPVQPEFVPGDRDFGLFPAIDSLGVSMQLEEAGLRARIRWRMAAE